MARKSKRMALYEAIRQGQENIAKGLESGHMRSDALGQKHKKTNVLDTVALFKKQNRSPGISALSKTLAVASGFAVLVVILFVIWLLMNFGGDSEAIAPVAEMEDQTPQPTMQEIQAPVQQPVRVEEEKAPVRLGLDQENIPEEKTVSQELPKPAITQGANVIVIQQIPQEQRDKLLPVQKFFNAKGVATEMIQRGGYTYLVTKTGFDYDPSRRGTEGYQLFQQVKQLGLAYPEATGDTKFGLRPFQDAYPLNKDK